ncbi:ankyrin repeat domain-containing protein [Armatimonas rosea]|uniref:Ankyrin repeat protein n=1 Tax=Armatimonas rosea TaxID=685828 RepID=A0A7W9W4S2_ARMRO|nr:ankyrin repeat domain-containing protein [Armatimonas rosea]MBB6048828.1 ankyrin repeat protein [Armatimonas rosea]
MPYANPLADAVEFGWLEQARACLAQGAPLDWLDTEYDYDLLDVALTSGFIEIAELLLDAGVPLERTRQQGESRLYWIAFCQQPEGVAFLLKHGASLAADVRGWTPLHAICWHSETQGGDPPAQEKIIRLLVAAGAPLEARASSGGTPLHWALAGDVANPSSVRILLELRANPNALDNGGSSPLHYAISEHCVTCVELLLASGANPFVANHYGETPLARAQREVKKREEIAREEPEWQWVADNAKEILALLEAAPTSV